MPTKSAPNQQEAYASFVVAPCGAGALASTTRAADRGEAGRIGLPGGKVDAGESARDAAIREAAEEGWEVCGVEDSPFYTAMVEGRLVFWFAAKTAVALHIYKEIGRISPVPASDAEIAASGYGNDAAIAAWRRLCL